MQFSNARSNSGASAIRNDLLSPKASNDRGDSWWRRWGRPKIDTHIIRYRRPETSSTYEIKPSDWIRHFSEKYLKPSEFRCLINATSVTWCNMHWRTVYFSHQRYQVTSLRLIKAKLLAKGYTSVEINNAKSERQFSVWTLVSLVP